ncbi:MAG: cytidine deaminase, partial [Hyphomicrobiales bacterium]|nr:cytidine deaminase [Hyphomicrobiales bacterium]
RARAHAPYSQFKVGAAIRGAGGGLHIGCNVENAAYPSGTCAEEAAIAAMIASGETRIAAIAVLGSGDAPVTPCGACRQRIREFATPATLVHAGSVSGARLSVTLDALLPHAFGPDLLAAARS